MINLRNGYRSKITAFPLVAIPLCCCFISVAWTAVLLPDHPVNAHKLRNHERHATANTSSFYELVTTGTFVDKSGLLKDFLERYDLVTRVIRPKGWGKSTNLDMMRTFLDIETDKNGTPLPADKRMNGKLFTGGQIRLACGKIRNLKPLEVYRAADTMSQQGTHPVVLVKLHSVAGCSYEEVIESKLAAVMADLYGERVYLKDAIVSDEEKKKFDSYLSGGRQRISGESLKESLSLLRDLLHRHFNRSVVILVDDYDTPLNSIYYNHIKNHGRGERTTNSSVLFDQAYNLTAFKRTFDFFKSWLENALQGTKGVLNCMLLTGVFHVAFSNEPGALNDIVGYSMQDRDLADYYGFTDREVDRLVERAPFRVNRDGLRRWYGYDFGGKKLYNPWSVRHFLANRGEFGSYWMEQDEWSLADEILAFDEMQEPLLHLVEQTTIDHFFVLIISIFYIYFEVKFLKFH